jgi:hypothetical protein
VQIKRKQQKEDIQAMLSEPDRRAELEVLAAQSGQTMEQLAEMLMNVSDVELGHLAEMEEGAPLCATIERIAYPDMRVLVPPAGIEENPRVEAIFKTIRMNGRDQSRGPVTKKTLRALNKAISKTWTINYTKLAEDW